MKRFFNCMTCAVAVSGMAFSALAGAATPGAAPASSPAPASAPLAAGVSRVTSPPVGKTAGQSRRTGSDPVDDRVELREYGFKDTEENLPYAVFVSSKVTKDKKAPLVLALHGFSGNHGTFMRTGVVDEAEKGGYILIGAMGYSPSGPFGMNFGGGGRGAPGAGRGAPGRGAPGAAPGGATQPATRPGAMAPVNFDADLFFVGAPGGARGGPGGAPGVGGAARGPGGGGRGGPPIGGTKETDAAKVRELSEKDAMYVLDMVCKEFNVDDRRIYLMGHSLGGGGSLYMGEKYADRWAGVAALAPAAFGFTWTAESKLKGVPLFIATGENDTTVRPDASRQLGDQLKGLNFKVELKIMPGLDHGSIIAGAQPEAFKFFEQNTKPAK